MKKIILFTILIISISSFSQNDVSSDITRDENRNKGYFNITRLSYITMSSLKQELYIEGEGNFFVPWKTGHWMIYPGKVWHRPGVVQSMEDRFIVAADMEF